MKRCPTCQRTFTDSNLSFCIDDGTPLSIVEDDETTVVSPPDDSKTVWGPAAYRPPSQPQPAAQKKSSWPWVLGIGGVAILLLAAFGIGAAVFIPKMMKQRQAAQTRPAPPSANNRSNQNTSTPNTNKTPEETVNTPPPTDKDLVLSQLTQLENEWTVANLNADKKKLEVILADDYVGPATSDPNGPTQGKEEYINTAQRNMDVDKWEFKALELTLRGDRATLSGKVDFTVRGRLQTFNFTDKFVWRNGRWQATGAIVVPATDS